MSLGAVDSISQLPTTEGIRPTAPTLTPSLSPTLEPTQGPSFESVLVDAVGQANSLDHTATQKADALAAGAVDDLHGTMISLKEADISMRLVGTVRTKILDAFQELWRTNV